MEEKLYNVFVFDDKNSFFEVDRFEDNNKTYLLLLQREEPNLLVVGFLEDEKAKLLQDKEERANVFKRFFPDNITTFNKLRPFIKDPEKFKKMLKIDD